MLNLNKKYFKSGLLMLALLPVHLSANENLVEFYKFFKTGQYTSALKSLESLSVNQNSLSNKEYLKGLSYSRLQEYDKAAIAFKKAIDNGNSNIDIQYEYGQALYANNELKKSRAAFYKSSQANYNKETSLYYVAYISQMLEEYEIAVETYTSLLKVKNLESKLKQITRYQLAESMLMTAREKSPLPDDLKNRVSRFILPMLQKAYEQDKTTPVSQEIFGRINDIKKEFDLDPYTMKNGRRLSPKAWAFSTGLKSKFDDNISLTSQENNTSASFRESYIFEAEAYAKYETQFKKRIITSPEVRLTYIEHSDQQNSAVFQNDSLTLNLNVKNKYEHLLNQLPASFIFDLDTSRVYKDSNAQKSRDFYAQAYTFTLGESFSYFNVGDTSIKFKYKIYSGDNTQINNYTKSLSLDQVFFLPRNQLLVALLDASFTDNYNNTTSNSNTYLLRFDYIIPEIMPTYNLTMAMGTTLTDTLEQKSTRGTELMLNPSIDLTKQINPHQKLSASIDYTKAGSDSVIYRYNKTVTTLEYKINY
jgi:tetratricopeptide (TPR) repeat protein